MYISNFLYQSFRDKKKVLLKSEVVTFLESLNWNDLIIGETNSFLEQHDFVIVGKVNLEKINVVCFECLKASNFKTAITYPSPTSTSTNSKCVQLAFLRKKLSLKFPENVLLDMLEFDFVYFGKMAGIGDIIEELGFEKSKKRILKNLENIEMYGSVLENHLQFCIDNNINKNNKIVYEYYLSDQQNVYTKTKCFEYLLKSNNLEYLNILFKNIDQINSEIWKHVVYVLRENMNNEILGILKKKLRNTSDDTTKMFIINEMIKQNIYSGVKEYYKWMKVNNRTYSDELNKCIGNLQMTRFIIINFKMFQLTFNRNFEDRRFHSLYENVKNSFILIGEKNEFTRLSVILLLKIFKRKNYAHKHIGFVTYIIEELNSIKEETNQTISIREIKRVLEKSSL